MNKTPPAIARNNAGFSSSRDAAKALGMTQGQLLKIERGEVMPSLIRAQEIANLYRFWLEVVFPSDWLQNTEAARKDREARSAQSARATKGGWLARGRKVKEMREFIKKNPDLRDKIAQAITSDAPRPEASTQPAQPATRMHADHDTEAE